MFITRQLKLTNESERSYKMTFLITGFYTIIDRLRTEMRKRGEIYKEIPYTFS
jgi:hypothetical protein